MTILRLKKVNPTVQLTGTLVINNYKTNYILGETITVSGNDRTVFFIPEDWPSIPEDYMLMNVNPTTFKFQQMVYKSGKSVPNGTYQFIDEGLIEVKPFI
jgi:hypothetical protein